MKYTAFYTIKELDYTAIREKLNSENISSSLRADIQRLILDHSALIASRKKIVEEQNVHANVLFHLFDDPPTLPNEPNKKEEEILPPLPPPPPPPPPMPNPKKRNGGGKKKLPEGKVVKHSLTQEEKQCPCCKNKMHMQRSKQKTYVLALPMLSTETHVLESYRCLSCETHSTASSGNNLVNESIYWPLPFLCNFFHSCSSIPMRHGQLSLRKCERCFWNKNP